MLVLGPGSFPVLSLLESGDLCVLHFQSNSHNLFGFQAFPLLHGHDVVHLGGSPTGLVLLCTKFLILAGRAALNRIILKKFMRLKTVSALYFLTICVFMPVLRSLFGY